VFNTVSHIWVLDYLSKEKTLIPQAKVMKKRCDTVQ